MEREDFDGIRVRMADLNLLRTLWNEELEKEFARLAEQRYGSQQSTETFQHMTELYQEASIRVDYQCIVEETSTFLFQLCDIYLKASIEQQDMIRVMLGENKSVLPALQQTIYSAESQLAQTGAEVWFRRGLALASMEDCRIDYRDTYLALCSLCTEAAKHGIETGPYFQRGEPGEFALDASAKTGLGFAIPAPQQNKN